MLERLQRFIGVGTESSIWIWIAFHDSSSLLGNCCRIGCWEQNLNGPQGSSMTLQSAGASHSSSPCGCCLNFQGLSKHANAL